MAEFMESPSWVFFSQAVLLAILVYFSHFTMTKFGTTPWMKALTALLTFTLYWVFFGLEHPLILLSVVFFIGLQSLKKPSKN
jgi:hypothetical protein|tara:strand:- start:903 stop:1148 length:246 start_codon:yes stop_codon:yes gene_type:complete